MDAKIKDLEEKLVEMYDPEVDKLKKQMTKVWRDNLLVPGFIGLKEDCQYKNLADYLANSSSGIEKRFEDLNTSLR